MYVDTGDRGYGQLVSRCLDVGRRFSKTWSGFCFYHLRIYNKEKLILIGKDI
jgi:hypothetical protein